MGLDSDPRCYNPEYSGEGPKGGTGITNTSPSVSTVGGDTVVERHTGTPSETGRDSKLKG